MLVYRVSYDALFMKTFGHNNKKKWLPRMVAILAKSLPFTQFPANFGRRCVNISINVQ